MTSSAYPMWAKIPSLEEYTDGIIKGGRIVGAEVYSKDYTPTKTESQFGVGYNWDKAFIAANEPDEVDLVLGEDGEPDFSPSERLSMEAA